eukprot:COSAG01_NODE_4855_length_4680_cov_17.726697_5_plen_276_part_00
MARQAQLREAVELVRDPANLLVSRGEGAGTTDAAVLVAGSSSTEEDPSPAPAFDAAPVLARASAAASACEAAEQQRSHTTVLWLGMRAQATRSEARALGQQAAALVRQLRDEEEEEPPQPESLCAPPDDDVGAAAAAHAPQPQPRPQPYQPPAHSDPRWESALESGALTVDRCARPRLSCWSRQWHRELRVATTASSLCHVLVSRQREPNGAPSPPPPPPPPPPPSPRQQRRGELPRRVRAGEAGAWACPPSCVAILAEIYLRDLCSCHEITGWK